MEQAENSRRANRDMISALPGCLLHLIMSFLTLKNAVQTCILSKRWKCLWATLPFLDFAQGYDEWFINFVNATLLLREPTDVQSFRLACQDLPSPHPNLYRLCLPRGHPNCMTIRAWILYVLKHNPKLFDIGIPSNVELPMGVFTCSSLEDVTISTGQFPSTGVIELPCLKRLHLQNICVCQDFVEKLFRGCPILESLHLDRCTLEFSSITSQSLKYLHVQTYCYEFHTVEKSLGLIDAPNLLSFYYGDCPNYLHRTILHAPSLTYVTLSFSCCSNEFNNRKTNIFASISNIQNLKLRGPILKGILENELLGCPKFPNLKCLFVDKLCLSCHFSVLASIINDMPNLEKLSLVHRGCICKMSKEHGNQELLKISPFQCKQLKTVEVHFCNSDEDFPKVLKYIHKSVLNLKVQMHLSTFS